jgi:hypothetical protein
MRLQAEQIVAQCQRETGLRGDRAREVILIALLVAPDKEEPIRQYRNRIRETYLRSMPERGSFFLFFVLPILVSVISTWINRWIWDQRDFKAVRSEAFDLLIDSSLTTAERLTSISSTRSNQRRMRSNDT